MIIPRPVEGDFVMAVLGDGQRARKLHLKAEVEVTFEYPGSGGFKEI